MKADNISVDNICSLLVDDYFEYGYQILSQHLDILEAGIRQLKPNSNIDDSLLLSNMGLRIQDYFNRCDINTLDAMKPHTDMWLRLLELDLQVQWKFIVPRLPKILCDRLNLEDIYAGGKHIDCFITVSSLGHLNNILMFPKLFSEEVVPDNYRDHKRADYYLTSRYDYDLLINAFCNLLIRDSSLISFLPWSDISNSFFKIEKCMDTLRNFQAKDTLDITYDRLPILLFELVFYQYAIKWYDQYGTAMMHLSLPPNITVDMFETTNILECLEYNYADKCPPAFFNQLKTYVSLLDVQALTLPMLQEVYNTTTLAHNYVISSEHPLPEFV